MLARRWPTGRQVLHRRVDCGLPRLLPVVQPTSSEDFRKAPPCDIKEGDAERKAEQHAAQGSQMIRGEVMRVEGTNYLVKQQDGKQVSLQTDEKTTQPVIHQGQHIEANVNDHNLALWIRTNNETDRRNEHAASDCTPN